MQSAAILRSPAKLNLVLDLLFKRSDGYHEVDFVIQELELHDTITLRPVSTPNAISIACNDPHVPTDEKNLAFKAAQVMQEAFSQKNNGQKAPGVEITLDKKIPTAGGLGGGSSNGATVLKGLNQAWKLGLTSSELAQKAAVLGSDAPFFIYGGTCRAQGRGEKITPLKPCPLLFLTFIVPPVKVPANKTVWIYSHFRVEHVPAHPSIERMRAALKDENAVHVAQACANIFEYLDLPAYAPAFALIKELKSFPNVYNAFLAGAGPTICAACEDARTAQHLANHYSAKGLQAFITRTA